ncbi:MAG: cbb3-type cytochrome c oxidase subunit I [Hyphomicrobiales bacterium]
MAAAGLLRATYFLVPEEAERELHSEKLAYLQLVILVIGAGGAVVGYLFHIHEGREFLEQPLWVKLGINVAALIFLYNVTMTVLQAARRRSPTSCCWGFGALPSSSCSRSNPANLALDKMYWWYVVHLWVEGVSW